MAHPGIRVKQLFQEYRKRGLPDKEAAKLAQAETGYSVVSGRPINRQLPGHPTRAGRKEEYVGQYKQYRSRSRRV
jgi:hypothetical protein